MQTNTQSETTSNSNPLQATIGIYPVTSLGMSFYHYCKVDLLICRKNGITAGLFTETPEINIDTNDGIQTYNIKNHVTNGMLEAYNKGVLPQAILCTPHYQHLTNLTDELTELAIALKDDKKLLSVSNLNRFSFPTIILGSNGIIYDETIYSLQTKLQAAGLSDILVRNICNKVIRASIMQGAHREKNTYFHQKKGLLKLAVPKSPMFSQVMGLLNQKDFTFSIHKSPHRIEFEKAMVNIASNSIALIFALDQKNYKYRKVTMAEALAPENATHATFVNEVQKAIFTIGQKAGAFSEAETFETVWLPRKQQILKHDSNHASSSLYCFREMLITKTFSDELPTSEQGLVYPLKCFARHYQLYHEIVLMEELERMLYSNLAFARKYADEISVTF